jgi:ubiquinone/menaquinone biosynthesis C-methylase UbiE
MVFKRPLPGSIGIDIRGNVSINGSADNLPICSDSIDYVYSSHCLEHLAGPVLVLKEWKRVLKVNGKLFLYLPHEDASFWSIRAMPKFHFWELNDWPLGW